MEGHSLLNTHRDLIIGMLIQLAAAEEVFYKNTMKLFLK